ncbi:hypothetical protein ERO13_D10G221100v2 [Gossypium hirsutum]|nr:hypothetical protein ERO13_D10G221100v2 [Gossypium hirsutum]
MDERLRTAARTGNVADLYNLIQRDGNVLRHFDEVEFVDTPLHIAAEEGCIRFAMEMMNLKPAFARKLNQQGLSPLHIAVKQGHKEMALRFLEMDKDLGRVKGKNENNRLDVLQVLIRTIWKTDYYREVVNQMDEDGNTALHLAAFHNQPEMLKLLLNCKADKHANNQAGWTAMDVAQQQHSRESITILRGCFIPEVSNFKCKLEKQIVKHVTKASSLIFHNMDNISGEDRNALLVILGLLLAATYQASLSPPGGVWQGENTLTSKGLYDSTVPRKSVMDKSSFLHFYIPTYIVFIVTFFLILALLKPFPHGFRTALQVLLAFLAMCFDQSISFIAPTFLTSGILCIFSTIIFILMVFMCIAYQVSKFSVSIVGCWIFSSFFLSILGREIVGGVIQGVLLFLFLSDESLKGTILVVGYAPDTLLYY